MNSKMPKMPDYLDTDLSHMSLFVLQSVVEDYGRACYLAGIEAAKACVPDRVSGWREWGKGFNDCCDRTLAHLDALERTASGANFPKKEEAKK